MESTEDAEDGYVGPIYMTPKRKRNRRSKGDTQKRGKGERNKVRKGFYTRHL